MGLVPVYVYDVCDVNDDVPWVPYKDIVPVFVHDDMADSRVRFVPRGMERDSTHETGTGLRVRRCYSGYRTRTSLTSLVTCRIFANRNLFSEPLQRLRCRVGSEGSDSPPRQGTATVLSWEASSNRRVCRVPG